MRAWNRASRSGSAAGVAASRKLSAWVYIARPAGFYLPILLQQFCASIVSVTFLRAALQQYASPRGSVVFRMAGDDGFADAHYSSPEILRPDALQADARAFEHQVKLVGEQFRVCQPGREAKLCEPFTLRLLEGLDHPPGRVLLLAQLDCGVRVRAAAAAAANHVLGHVFHPSMKLGQRIARMLGLEPFP